MKSLKHSIEEIINKWGSDPLYATADFVTARHELQSLLDGDKPVPQAPSPGIPQPEPTPPLTKETLEAGQREPDAKGQPTHKETTRPERVQSDDAETEHPKPDKFEAKSDNVKDSKIKDAGTTTSAKTAHK